ncbi:MAG TPA: PEGA domain-containing protein, partial [bacterium (Candidatus Stahlbacteria)]|nr:PEGA domain-containing protein [Candidatus Stahlbacteria bacterium]
GIRICHKKGLIHRDIKPGNILMSYEGKAKIADFGLAKAREQSALTVTGALVGTPAYMSPEQAVGKTVEPRSDLFSLGIVLYEMLTGVQPFRGETYSGVINEIVSKTPRPLTEIKPAIFDVVEDLINGLLAKDIDKRFPDAGSARKTLDHVVKALGIEFSDDMVSDFLKDPVRYASESKKRFAEHHLRRGLYLMKLGLDRIDDAIMEFKRVLEIDPDNTEAKEKLEQLKKKRKARISPLFTIPVLIAVVVVAVIIIMRGGRGRVEESYPGLSILTRPESGSVFLNGRNIGLAPIQLDSVAPGDHIIEARLEGYLPSSDTVTVLPGSTMKVVLNLTKEAKLEKRPVVKPKPRAKTGTLIVKTYPKAEIFIDGREATSPIRLPVGVHNLLVKKKGYQPWQGEVRIIEGAELTKEVRLKALPGYISVRSKPWADFFINGRYISTTPIKKLIKLKPGYHRFKLSNPDYWPWEDSLHVRPGETLRIDQTLVPK